MGDLQGTQATNNHVGQISLTVTKLSLLVVREGEHMWKKTCNGFGIHLLSLYCKTHLCPSQIWFHSHKINMAQFYTHLTYNSNHFVLHYHQLLTGTEHATAQKLDRCHL